MALIDEGDYDVKVTEAYLGYDNFGNEAVCIAFTIKDELGQVVRWTGGFDGEWLERTVRSLRNCGFVGDDLGQLAKIIGNNAVITVNHKTSARGTTYLQVFINGRRSMEPADAATFAKRMQRIVASVGVDEDEPPSVPTKKSPAIPPTKMTAAAAIDEEDDCPF